jgi:transcriptional regulator with XRE-family HTH domain
MRDNARAVRLRVGRNVRRLRRVHGWSQERLAELVGNTNKHIGQIERGEVNVTLDILAAIAEGFSVNVSELFAAADTEAGEPRIHSITQADVDHLTDLAKRLKRSSRWRKRSGSD